MENIVPDHSFTTADFFKRMRTRNPDVSRATVYNALRKLCDAGKITRTGRGHFTSVIKSSYSCELSQKMLSIAESIRKKYPLVNYQVWELRQLNEFLNHQIVRNTLFAEVEGMQEESIFEMLYSEYDHVLFKPSVTEYFRYMGEETVVVQKLISEAPPAYGRNHQAQLEKILVDLWGKGLPGQLIEGAEYPAILEQAFEQYSINQAKLFRYARRRGLEEKIKKIILDETNIRLEGQTI